MFTHAHGCTGHTRHGACRRTTGFTHTQARAVAGKGVTGHTSLRYIRTHTKKHTQSGFGFSGERGKTRSGGVRGALTKDDDGGAGARATTITMSAATPRAEEVKQPEKDVADAKKVAKQEKKKRKRST